MSTFDVRAEATKPITEIMFSEPKAGNTSVAYFLTKFTGAGVKVKDDSSEYVVIRDKEHAANLRKALDKAEELGWLK